MEKSTKDLEARVWLSPAQAVRYSGIGRARLYGFLADGTIPSAKIGATRHIRRVDLDGFMTSHVELHAGHLIVKLNHE